MKIIINYDFLEKIKDVKEDYGVMKIVRNKKRYLLFNFAPFCIAIDLPIALMNLDASIILLIANIYTYFLIEYYFYKELGDTYKEKAITKLKSLVSLLNDIDVKTSYDLLLEAEVYEKKYKIHLNEKKIPEIIESKYILVPTYNYYGEIRNTSILEEHVVGSDDYVLSLGSPEKELKLVYTSY